MITVFTDPRRPRSGWVRRLRKNPIQCSFNNNYNGHYWSGIFSGKTEKMATGSDECSVDFRYLFADVLSNIARWRKINTLKGIMVNVCHDPNTQKGSHII